MLSQKATDHVAAEQENAALNNSTPMKPALSAKTPITERRGLREITNSARKDQPPPPNTVTKIPTTVTKRTLLPSKLSSVVNSDDVMEPEYAPIFKGTP